jgi:hypothetical protein
MTSLEELRQQNDKLKQELDDIAVQKAKKEQDDLKAKLEAQHKLDLEAHDKELIAKVKAEMGIGVQSKAPETTQQATTSGQKEDYKAEWVSRHQARGNTGIKGRSYTELLQDLQRESAFR